MIDPAHASNLIGRSDIAEIFDAGRSAVAAWIDRHSEGLNPFPQPFARINHDATEVYERDRVEAWGRITGRLPLMSGRIYDNDGFDITDTMTGELIRRSRESRATA